MRRANKLFREITLEITSFLERSQSKDGSFVSVTSSHASFKASEDRKTTFFTSIVLSALNCVATNLPSVGTELSPVVRSKLDRIRKGATQFLLAQFNNQCSVNYWARDYEYKSEKQYPDDLDDTALALYALNGYDDSLMTPASVAKLTKLLISAQTHPGGPYRTWLISPSHSTLGGDIDLVVNINIRNILFALGIELPELEGFMVSSSKRKNAHLPYYYDRNSVPYFISRTPERTASHLFRIPSLKTLPKSVLSLALSTSARSHFKKKIPKPEGLFRLFRENFKKAYPFGVEKVRHKKRYFSAAPALTAALTFEALIHSFVDEKREVQSGRLSYEVPVSRLLKLANSQLPNGDNEFRNKLKDLLAKTLNEEDRSAILSLPYQTERSLRYPMKKSNTLLEDLSVTGLYGWVGYTTADHILDRDSASDDLPYAIALMRMTAERYIKNAETSDVKKMVNKILYGMDEAVAWEQSYCRDINRPADYGDYRNLAKRSMGHAIGSLLILAKSHCPTGIRFKAMVALRKYFEHYIIARQLNDDAHDWIEDLKRGNLNSVSSLLMHLNSNKHYDSAADRIEILKKTFWEKGMDEVAEQMFFQIKHARLEMKYLKKVMNTEFLEDNIRKLEKSAELAIKERNETSEFLDAYRESDIDPPGK